MIDKTPSPMRVETYTSVRDLILSGSLPEGSRIVESALCQKLGVSRTPLREALFRLEQEGLVRQDLARGFSVLPLSAREVREIYPIIWTLERLALELTESFDVGALKKLNQSLESERAPEKQHEIDDRFHAELLAACKNKRLLKQIAVLKQAAQRYELAYMRYCNKIGTSVEHHRQLVEALSDQDVARSGQLLEKHWRFSMQTLLDWLDWQGE